QLFDEPERGGIDEAIIENDGADLPRRVARLDLAKRVGLALGDADRAVGLERRGQALAERAVRGNEKRALGNFDPLDALLRRGLADFAQGKLEIKLAAFSLSRSEVNLPSPGFHDLFADG